MKKVFLDIGAHEGETVEIIVKPDYLFDVIHCFEPMPEAFARLSCSLRAYGAKPDMHNPNKFYMGEKTVILNNFGLADIAGERAIFGEGIYASLYDGVRRADEEEKLDRSLTTSCEFVEASDYFRQYLVKDNLNIMKMNCEGAEVEILRNLLESGEIFKINHVMIAFDAFKIKNMRDKPFELLRCFRKNGFRNYNLAVEVMPGSINSLELRYCNWFEGLSFAKAIMKNPQPFGFRRRIRYWWRRYYKRPLNMMQVKIAAWQNSRT